MNVPTPDDSDLVRRAVDAMAAFGRADLDRSAATRLLALWRHQHLLTEAQRAEVLSRYPRHHRRPTT